MEQELRRLAHGAHEQQEADDRHRVRVPPQERHRSLRDAWKRGEGFIKAQGSDEKKRAENAQREAEVAHAVDDERLYGGGAGGLFFVPEADQQIGRQSNPFPAEEHLDEVVGGHQHEHGEGKEREIGKEPGAMRVFVHVPDRIEVNERGNRVDHDQHDRRQRIDAQHPVDLEIACMNPRQDGDLIGLAIAQKERQKDNPRKHRCDHQQRCGDDFRGLVADGAAKKASHQRADQRQEYNCLDHGRPSPSSC